MKKATGCSKQKAVLINRLTAYSATAGAALLAAPVGHAAITPITSFTHVSGSSLSNPPSFQLHGNGYANEVFSAGVFKMNFYFRVRSTDSNAHFIQKAGTQFFQTANYTLAKFPGGAAFAPPPQAGITGRPFFRSQSYGGNSGQFLPVGNNAVNSGYFAFKEQKNGTTYYGWMRLKVKNNATGRASSVGLIAKDGAPLVFGAFDKKADIAADGFTIGSAAVPEPSSVVLTGLGLLAFGAAGIREYRRRKATA